MPESVHPEDGVFAHLYTLSAHCYRKAFFRPGENVAVIGLGVLGLGAVAIGPLFGARVVGLGNSPVRKGGPGPKVFIRAWQVLRLAGEPVTPESYQTDKAAQMRYSGRMAELKAHGYFTARTGAAPAGGTVEIVEKRKGGRHHPAGLFVRASARFCAAYQSGERELIPADRAIEAAGQQPLPLPQTTLTLRRPKPA